MTCAVVGAALVSTTPQAGAATVYSTHLTRAPYLTDLVGLHVAVNWATDKSATTGSLQWGPVVGGNCQLGNTLGNPTSKGITVGSVAELQWTASLSLPAQGSYCYRPLLGATDLLGGFASPQFQTQVAAGDTTPYSFDVLGDWGQTYATGNPDQQNVMARIAQSGARFAVTVGDNGYPNGSQINYGDLQQTGADTSAIFGPAFWTVPASSVPIFTAPGNHGLSNSAHTDIATWTEAQAVLSSGGTYSNETYCCVNGTFSANYGSEWYAFDAGPARFYVLDSAWGDSNVGTANVYANDAAAHFAPGDEEYTWLVNDLKTHPSALKFAFSHYPAYSDSNSQPSDTYLQGTASLEGLLAQYGVNIWFNGHSHIYERNAPSAPGMPVTYVTGGGGSALGTIGPCHPYDAYGIGSSSACGSAPKPTSPTQVFHFLKVTVSGTTVTVTPTDENGNTFDVQTYNFGNASVPDTLIDSAPGTPTNSTSATFTFHSTRSGATFACSLDSATATPCASPQTYAGLADGAHTFTVVSTSGGATDPSPAVCTWTVDTVAPNAPTGLSATVASSRLVNLSWTAVADAASYDVIRNGTAIGTASASATTYPDSTVAPSSAYHYVIDARDGAGNVSPPSDQTPDVTTPAGPAGPALVQSAGSSTATITLPSPSTPGDLLVLSASVYTGTSQPITSVTDGANTWTRIKAVAVSGQYSDGELWYAPNAASVSAVRVTTSASTVALRLQEFTGLAATAPLDASAAAAATSTSAASGSATPSGAGELAVGFVAGHGKNQAANVTSPGFTVDPQQTTTSPNVVSVVSAWQMLPSTAPVAFSATFAAAMYWAAGVAVFKAAPALPSNDFAVVADPASVTATQGSASTASTITAPLVSGSPQQVALSAANLPAGATAAFTPQTITSDGTGSATLTVTTSAGTPAGSYALTITGTGTVTRTATVSLIVNAPAVNDFTLAATPAAVTVTQGATSPAVTVTAALTPGSAAQQVTVCASGLPAQASAGFAPATISSDGGSSTLTITTTNGTPAGTYSITITGTGATTESTTVSLTVEANSFTLAANPAALTATQGGTTGSSTVSATLAAGGSAQQVAMAASGLPPGATATFAPATMSSDGGTAVLTIATTASTPAGSYAITITGTGDSSATATATVTFAVAAPVIDDFTLAASPTSVVATQGGAPVASTITATLASGNAQTVSLSASGLPGGASATFDQTSISSAAGSATLTITPGTSAPGTYQVVVTGAGPSATHTVAVTLRVITAGTPQLVQQAAGTATATTTSLNATFSTPTTAGDLLVLTASVYAGATNHLSTVTDSAGNTWTRVGAYFASGHYSDGEIWYATAASPVSTVTVKLGTAASVAFQVMEFSGIGAAIRVDAAAGASNTGTSASSGTLTPAAAGELVVGFVAGHGSAQTMNVATPGFTVGPQATTTGTAVTVRSAYQVVPSTAAIGIGATFGTSMYWAAAVVAFVSAV